jgi:hypothetical protein
VAAVVEPLLPVGGVGLTRALMTGMTEFVSGRATQVALNLVSGERWDTNLWNPQDPQWQLDVLLDVVPGVGAGLLGEAWQAARAARYADLPSVSGLDDAVRYADDVPSVGRFDDAGRYADDLAVRARQSDVPSAPRQLDPEQRAAGKALLKQRLREIAPQMGIDDPYSLVDEVVFHERWTNPEFAVGPGGRRAIRAGSSFLERSEAGQLIAAAHELDHAQRWDDLVRASGGDWEYAARIHRSANDTVLESLEEIAAEHRALNVVREYLGEIDPRTLVDSVDYINRNARDAVARAWSDLDAPKVRKGGVGRLRADLDELQARWKEAGFDVENPKIQQLINEKYSPEEVVVLYRGQGEWHDRVLSRAAREGGIEYSERQLKELPNTELGRQMVPTDRYGGDPFKRALAIHKSPAYRDVMDPFIAMTENPTVATRFAHKEGGMQGVVLEIVIPKSEAIKVADVAPGLEDVLPELEWVVLHELPRRYITSHWGVKWNEGDPVPRPAWKAPSTAK